MVNKTIKDQQSNLRFKIEISFKKINTNNSNYLFTIVLFIF